MVRAAGSGSFCKGRSDAPIYAMLARVQMGDPPILILNKEKALGGQVNVIFGLVSKTQTNTCAAAASSSGAGSDGPEEPANDGGLNRTPGYIHTVRDTAYHGPP